jgi:phosphate starvation-inducible protein PhoH
LKNNKDRDKVYKNFSEEQKIFFDSIKNYIFTFCEATSGSGKTLVSVSAMLDLLANEEINKIIYIQSVTQRFLQNGFLPGTIEEKTESLWQPFYDAMLTLGYAPFQVDAMINNGLIVLTTDSNLRGVNFEKVGVITEESQNMRHETLKLIYTRCHDSAKIVTIGDSRQKDNKGSNNDFILYGDYLASAPFGNKCYLTKNFRGKFSQYAENFGV